LNCVGKNSGECQLNGRLIQCGLGEVCATTVQRNGMVSTIVKQCKQRQACLNEEKQVVSEIYNFSNLSV